MHRASGLRPYADTGWEEQLIRVANRIAVNRTIAGVHFPVDSAAGAVIGMTLGTYLAQRCQVPATPSTATLPYDAYTFVGPSFPDSGGPMADEVSGPEAGAASG